VDTRTEIRLRLTAQERAGLTALAAGLRGVAESELSEEDAMVAALEGALTRLLDDFEVPDPEAREQVRQARNDLRAHWVRGSATL
jgi:multidrug efflux pump subunit AcrA (membrane-fusion protein)